MKAQPSQTQGPWCGFLSPRVTVIPCKTCFPSGKLSQIKPSYGVRVGIRHSGRSLHILALPAAATSNGKLSPLACLYRR